MLTLTLRGTAVAEVDDAGNAEEAGIGAAFVTLLFCGRMLDAEFEPPLHAVIMAAAPAKKSDLVKVILKGGVFSINSSERSP